MLRAGCASQIAVRAWASAACSAQGPNGAAAACSSEASPVQWACRWFTHDSATNQASFSADSSPSSSARVSLQPAGPSHAAHFSTASAALATAGATAASAGRQRLEVVTDIPVKARAKLADELNQGPSARGRRERRPQAAASADGDAAAALAAESGKAGATVSELDEEEVRIVFDKLVGGLTKSGRKGTARRIVLDAMRIMRQQLRKGSLEEVK
ncbi:hypothetical protein Agub_g6893 [Astrephomene gubernaculifera]|uniref:Uncharacterized protein n=1 Tax=Astrephomene gubernaculifera TaxID=47775 RepID=A0AAD3DP89_9CHLO|nr:hypothetical protein Agub_g6893 [Astrephomene gubernaculifera]